MKLVSLWLPALLSLFICLPAFAVDAPPPADRMAWFRDAKFGMFIHWGLYSIPAGVYKNQTNHAEWYIETTHMPTSQYEKFADEFNPVKFDADQWAGAAADAGVKYLCITSMHHDGFAMWPSPTSNVDNWSLSRTPFGKAGRDPLMELKTACEKRGVKFCLYHTIMDWHSPLYGGRRGYTDVAAARGIAPDMDKFQAYVEASVGEIIARYHPAMLWFDGNWEKHWTRERGAALLDSIHQADPMVIVNNRIGKSPHDQVSKEMLGDYLTPEQFIPNRGFGPGVAFETCMTMNGTWGYNSHNHDWKSTQTLIRNLCNTASKGGNYLLNVGPTGQGEIPAPSLERLAQIGQWMKVNSAAIYATSAGPFPKELKWGRATTKGNMLYLMIFDIPADHTLLLPGLKTKAKSAWLLADAAKTPLTTAAIDRGTTVTLLENLVADPNATVVAVELESPPEVDESAALVTPQADGTLLLTADDAAIKGDTAKVEGDHIGFWTDASDSLSWKCAIPKAGTYTVSLPYACANDSPGSTYELSTAASKITGKIHATGGWSNFITEKLDPITIAKAGSISIHLTPTNKPGLAVMNLRTISVVPIAP